ncbi:hypothetical protein KJ359_010567 [Pestalotiopsis sp. 9143b]|nr:hypothetical protein KJ359_010567 [Pestalotiopsis sp. 9143b]
MFLQIRKAPIPTVREAKISQDKTDPKKVVTTSFYKARSGKLATCHAHGDGTWSIAFTGLGREELRKREASGGAADLVDVDVRVEVRDDILYHHGEMRNKPLACRGAVSMNSDEVHRVHHDNDDQRGAEFKTQEPKAISGLDSNKKTDNPEHQKAGDNHNPPRRAYYNRGRIQLSDTQQLLASELAREGLTKKEERAIFQQLKAMPWEEQERILQQSKSLKSGP